MVYGETGKGPVEIHVKSRVLCYWLRLCHPDNQHKISSVIYKCLLKLHRSNQYESMYLTFIKNTLQDIGMSGFWLNQDDITCNPDWFKEKVKRGLYDNFLQRWYMSVDNDSVFFNYRMFKPAFGLEPFMSMLPVNIAVRLSKFRTTNNRLPVNTMRFENVPRHARLCQKCNQQDVGDEFHYLFCCPYFSETRKTCLQSYFQVRPSAIKFEQLFRMSKKKLLKLVHLVDVIQRELA